ncbi:ROK family protein [Mammaliicoccus sp. Dog046]|uniref:ROK family protein n=1 Tax=Mammaliicoccus sp. Dog046 TaxID=3034233 RepID=UPI002B26458F|nr:ROK family protein [Mammaliicoccus sp. Dog046]WQK85950.1 ROK family protein [Mammaliicoccus sp. Dog046]
MDISIDIGGTYIKSCVIDNQNQMHSYKKIETPSNKEGSILEEVKKIIESYKQQFQLENPNVGISTAGVVDSEKGVITYAGPTMPYYDGTNFKEALSDITNKVVINNDVSCALLGELGDNQQKYKSIFLLTIGTGIGGAYFENQLLEGYQYRACEIGYLLYDKETKKTYEDRGSTTALKNKIKQQYHQYLSVEQLFEEAAKGDVKANTVLKEWGKDVAEGIAQIQIIFDPEIILIGGGISQQRENLISFIEPFIDDFLPEAYGHATITTTSKGNDSALYGAISAFHN